MIKHNANNERIKRRYFSYLKEAKRQSEGTVDTVAKAKNSTLNRPLGSRNTWPNKGASKPGIN